MAKRPTKQKDKPNEATASLMAALKFVSVAQKLTTQPFTEYCQIGNGRVIAYDGVLAAGCLVENDLYACPHSSQLLAALQKCGSSLSITQLANEKLSLKSGPFKAAVPCAKQELMPSPPMPDNPVAPLGDSLKDALEALAWLVSDTGQRMIDCAILLRANTAVVTNGHVLLEYWHGWDMPTIVLPATSAKAILKIGKPLKSFGYSGNSLTFWFEDDSWLKTQLYLEAFPDVDKILAIPANPLPVPSGLKEALAAIGDFATGNGVILDAEGLHTSIEDNEGATYEISGLSQGCFSDFYLHHIVSVAESIDFAVSTPTVTQGLIFYGKNIRGIVAGMKYPRKSVETDKAWQNGEIHWFHHPESSCVFIHRGEVTNDIFADGMVTEITYDEYIKLDKKYNPKKYDLDDDIPF